MNFFTLILRNLFRHKRRSLLTLLGIVISFFLFVSIFTLLEAFNSKLKSEAAQVNLFFRPTYMSNFIDGQLPEAFIHKLKTISFIQYLAPYKVYLGTGRSSEKNIFVLGSYVDQLYHLRNFEGVNALQMDQMLGERKAALVGIDMMKENEWKLGEEVILKGIRGLPDLPIHIVGIPEGRSDFNGAVLVHYDYLKDMMKDGGIFSVLVFRVESAYQVPWVVQVIEERFQNSSPPVEAITEKGFIESILNELSAIGDAIKIIAWITLLATLLVVGNTMAMSIRERSTEQGVLRTLGFSKWAIFRLYLSESIALSFFGALLGAVLSCLLFTFIPIAIPGGQGRPSLAIEPYWALLKTVMLLALAMGLLSGFPPAFFSMRRKITDTLRFLA